MWLLPERSAGVQVGPRGSVVKHRSSLRQSTAPEIIDSSYLAPAKMRPRSGSLSFLGFPSSCEIAGRQANGSVGGWQPTNVRGDWVGAVPRGDLLYEASSTWAAPRSHWFGRAAGCRVDAR